jgi:hypothetical protein
MIRPRIGQLLFGLALVGLVGLALPREARSKDHDFKVTFVVRATSFEQVGDQIVVHAEGSGTSALLGPITITATVTQSPGSPCDQFHGVFDLVASGGTVQISSQGTVCSPPGMITGNWTVTGGTGDFAGAVGSGTENGKPSFLGNDPVIDHWEGTLSY